MPNDADSLARIDSLLGRASEIREDWSEWRGYAAQVLTAIAAIAGADSDYYEAAQTWTNPANRTAAGVSATTAGLRALRSDVANGYLKRQADLVAAEVFGDFLDMAAHLVDTGYHQPAASLIGAVLEDGLRRIARNADVQVKPGDDLSVLNNRLAAKNVYSNLHRKQVDVWAAIRNRADHAEWDSFSLGDVQDMYAGVTRFLSERLG
jgi:hypothetical protein